MITLHVTTQPRGWWLILSAICHLFFFELHNKTYCTYTGTTTGTDRLKIDMKATNEPATATKPVNWRVIQEEFPETTGVMDVWNCICKFNWGEPSRSGYDA